MSEQGDRARIVARIVVKEELDRAAHRALARLGLPDTIASRTPLERIGGEILRDRVRRSDSDPMARVRL